MLCCCLGMASVGGAFADESSSVGALVDPQATEAVPLAATTDGFSATDTADVPVTIPQDPRAPLTMQTASGPLSLVADDVATSADDGTLQHGSTVSFSGTAPDATTLVQAQPAGMEIFTQIDGPAAPTTYTWTVGLRGQERLIAQADGSVRVVDPTPPAVDDHASVIPDSASEATVDATATGMTSLPEPRAGDATPEPAIEAPADARELSSEDLGTTTAESSALADDVDARVQIPAETTVATIAAPTASDADGNPVPATLSVDGDTVTLQVAHDFDTAYPVMADPLVTVNDYAMVTHAAPVGVRIAGMVDGGWAIRNAPAAAYGLDRAGNILYAVNLWGVWYLVYDLPSSPALVSVNIDVNNPPPGTAVVWKVWRSYDQVGSHVEFQFDPQVDCGSTGSDGYLALCADDSSNPDDVAGVDDDPDVTFGADDGGEVRAASASSGSRYRINVSGGGWTTIRNRYQSYVIGNVHDGAHIDAFGAKQGWRAGEVGGSWNWACGWVRVKNTPNALGPAKTNCTSDWRPKITTYAAAINCKHCTHGESVPFKSDAGAVSECVNVFPGPNGTGSCETPSDVPAITADQTKNGYHVSWRYETTDLKYVLVNDPHNPSNHGRWVFVRRSSLGKLPSTPAAEDHK